MNSRIPLCAALIWLTAGSAPALQAQHHGGHGPPADAPHAARTFIGEAAVSDAIEQRGAEVALELIPRTDLGAEAGLLVENRELEILFRVTDEETGAPLSGRSLTAWIDRRKEPATSPEACREKIASYLRGTLQVRPVLDLNSQFLLALNEGNTISVIDPVVGFNVTQFYTTAILPGQGEDWVLSPAEDRLFVTVPRRNSVAVVSTETWKVIKEIPVGLRPGHVRFQPDGRYAWVDREGDVDGVSVIDALSLEVVAQLATGTGPHELAFTDDSRYALVSNAGDGTLAVIDAEALAVLHRVQTGGVPTALDWSEAAGAAFVADEMGGIVVVAVEDGAVTKRIETAPGLRALGFEPTGRWGFAVNGETNEILVLDGVDGTVRDAIPFGDAPDEVAFTRNFVYVRSTGTPDVAMIPLDGLDRDGKVQFQTFPGGQQNPGPMALATSMGPDLAASSHQMDAIYVPNGPDLSIYYYHYMSGMPMPGGRISNWKFSPRAVMPVARNIREREAGYYDITARLEDAGDYDLVLLMDEPRVIHCFPFAVAEDPAEVAPDWRRVRVELVDGSPLEAGRPATVRFRLHDLDTEGAVPDLAGVYGYITSSRGWTGYVPADPAPDGVYEMDVELPAAGTYFLVALSYENGLRAQEQVPARLAVP